MKRNERPMLIGAHAGRHYRFRLDEGGHTVGSLPDNRICLELSGISRRHAVLRRTGDRLTVEDLASKNGTFVNDERVTHATLHRGDRLRFASVTLRVDVTHVDDANLAVRLDSWSSIGASEALPTAAEETTDPFSGLSRPTAEWLAGQSSSNDFGSSLTFPDDWLPGSSPRMLELFRGLETIADSTLPVLLQGETGVGKEGIAHTIHLSSSRADGPFEAINCSAIPAELLEAELFGVGAGVATGVTARDGRFVEAAGGTLFLDEIGDMPAALQAKLLRVLEEGEVHPLGRRPQPIDVRIVAATHTDLGAAIAEGRFRRDLLFRLAGATLTVPPLRERRDDLQDLVRHFMTRASRGASKRVRGLTREAMQRIEQHSWPGNVRQLRHAVERWVHRCPNHQVIDDDLVRDDLASSFLEQSTPGLADGVEPNGFDPRSLASLDLAEIERRVIREALRRTDGNRTHAAAALGLSRQALRRRLARHGLEDE